MFIVLILIQEFKNLLHQLFAHHVKYLSQKRAVYIIPFNRVFPIIF